MRGEDNPALVDEIRRNRRFALVNVQTRAGNLTPGEGSRQRTIIDDTAASDIDQRSGRLHQRKLRGADGVMSLRRVRQD